MCDLVIQQGQQQNVHTQVDMSHQKNFSKQSIKINYKQTFIYAVYIYYYFYIQILNKKKKKTKKKLSINSFSFFTINYYK